MKIEEIAPLEIRPLFTEGEMKSNKYSNDSFICQKDDKIYMVVRHKYKKINNLLLYKNNILHGCSIIFEDIINDLDKENVKWGSPNDFIVDMNGIDNLMYAKAQIFTDSTIREIIRSIVGIEPTRYLRFGASGARANEQHPGGEVFEYQIIDGKNNYGISKSLSGYLKPPECEYSKSIALSENGINMREERIIYSHTAWIYESKENNNGLSILISSMKEEQSLLNIIYELIKASEIPACGIQIKIKKCEIDNIRIKGRVLKHMPEVAFCKLQEATDIAIEKEFGLPKGSVLYVMGTFYNRYEPDWERFTNGRKYEKRGHYHGTILGTNINSGVHQTFHVRDIWIQSGIDIQIEIYPIYTTYRIYSIHREGNELLLDSNNKNINTLLGETKKIRQ